MSLKAKFSRLCLKIETPFIITIRHIVPLLSQRKKISPLYLMDDAFEEIWLLKTKYEKCSSLAPFHRKYLPCFYMLSGKHPLTGSVMLRFQ